MDRRIRDFDDSERHCKTSISSNSEQDHSNGDEDEDFFCSWKRHRHDDDLAIRYGSESNLRTKRYEILRHGRNYKPDSDDEEYDEDEGSQYYGSQDDEEDEEQESSEQSGGRNDSDGDGDEERQDEEYEDW